MLATLALTAVLTSQGHSANWYKGNLHTHSLWSDGDNYPVMILDWYKSRGYSFVGLTEHNTMSEGAKWFDLSSGRGAGPALVKYIDKYGDAWVKTRVKDGKTQVLL